MAEGLARDQVKREEGSVEYRVSLATYDDLKLIARHVGRRTHSEIADVVVSMYGNALYSNKDVGGFELGCCAVRERRKKLVLWEKTVKMLNGRIIPKMIKRGCTLPGLDISSALNIIIPTFVDLLFPIFMETKLERMRESYMDDLARRARNQREKREKS